jgi:hypothetical protein
MLIINRTLTGMYGVESLNIGFEFNDINSTLFVEQAGNYKLYDKYGNISEVFVGVSGVFTSNSVLLELKVYSGFEESIIILVDDASVILPFSLEENVVSGIRYKYYKIRGFNNYCLYLANVSSTTKEIKMQTNYLHINGNTIFNKESAQLVSKSSTTVVDTTLNPYARPYVDQQFISDVDKETINRDLITTTIDNAYTIFNLDGI